MELHIARIYGREIAYCRYHSTLSYNPNISPLVVLLSFETLSPHYIKRTPLNSTNSSCQLFLMFHKFCQLFFKTRSDDIPVICYFNNHHHPLTECLDVITYFEFYCNLIYIFITICNCKILLICNFTRTNKINLQANCFNIKHKNGCSLRVLVA